MLNVNLISLSTIFLSVGGLSATLLSVILVSAIGLIAVAPRSLYYKTLRIQYVRKMDKF
jgi:hypothetical protein